MKTVKLFFMAALALMTAACSNDDNDIAKQPAKADGITITATLAPKDGGVATRAVEEGDNKICVSWAVNEHIAILYEKSGVKKVADATITAVNGSGAATISFTVESGTDDNTACTIVYPLSAAKDDNSGVKDAATLLAAQDGTLNANLDVRVGAGTIQTTTPNLTVTTQPEAQFAIFKFTVKNADASATINVNSLAIAIGEQSYSINPASPTSALYVALPSVSSQTVSFLAMGSDSKSYTCSKNGVSFDKGKYYQSALKMSPPPMLSLTNPALGQVIGSDGKNYAPGSLPTGITAVAMIAYMSGSNGLAIQLNANPVSKNWADAMMLADGLNTSIPFSSGTWRLPSKSDWLNMFGACAVSGDGVLTPSNDVEVIDPIEGFKSKITATGILWFSGAYWSSTEGSSMTAWRVRVLIDGGVNGVNANFYLQGKGINYCVLGCLAF